MRGAAGLIARTAIARPVTTAMVFSGLALLGALAFRALPIQLLPGYTSPQLFVQASYPGASPDTLEEDVLRRLEGEISAVGGVDTLASTARTGSATVTVTFRPGADLDLAALRVQERLESVKSSMPDAVQLGMQRFDTSRLSNFVMVLSLRGEGDVVDLKKLADDRVVPRLSAVEGVVQSQVQGGASRQVVVQVDPERARSAGASLAAVRDAVLSATRPVQSLGRVEEKGRALPVVLDGRATSVEDVAQAPLGRSGARVQDVAEMGLALASSVERYRVDGRTSVGLYVFKDPQANLLRVAGGLRRAVEGFNAEQGPSGARLAVDFDAAEIMEKQLSALVARAGTGALLSLLVLLVFLRDVRSVAVVAAAVPAALLVAATLFRAAGLSLNVLSLLGLALSVGMLLDNSIVVLESIAARRERGDPPLEAARRGAAMVQRAVVAGTLTTVIVFVPLFVVRTDFSPLFRELALSVVMPLLASLLVALTLVPVLASRLGRQRLVGDVPRWPGVGGLPQPAPARAVYSAVLRAALRQPLVTVASLMGLVLLTLVFGSTLVVLFAAPPRPSQERIEVKATLVEGSTTDQGDAVAKQVESMARGLPEVDEVRTSLREREVDVTILFKKEKDRRGALDMAAARRRLSQQAAKVLGARIEIDPPADADADAGGPDIMGTSGTTETVRVHGPAGTDLTVLAAAAERVLGQVPGLQGVRSDVGEARPTLEVQPDRERLASYGLTSADVMGVLWAARREGETTRQPLRLFGEDVDLALFVRGADRRSIDDVRRFPLVTRAGARVPLESVARVGTGTVAPVARRWQRDRTITLRYGFDPPTSGSAAAVALARASIDRAMASLPRAPGLYIDVAHADSQLKPVRQMLYLGLALVVLVLAITFESVTLPFLVLLAVPLAAAGVVASLVITGTGFDPFVIPALVVLLGLVANQGILFVDRSQELAAMGARRPAAILRAAHDRLRPILMTACATGVGMIPLAVSTGDEQEIWPPFARALLGGLAASTLISLVFIPAGALLFARLGELTRKLGPAATATATLACAAVLAWAYFWARLVVSEPLQWLLLAPAWLLSLAVTRALQAALRGESAPDLVGEGPVELRVRRARKIYGGLPRPLREVARLKRWALTARRHGMGAAALLPRRLAVRQLTWQAGALGLLVYLHVLARSTWGLALLTLPVLWLLGAAGRSAAGLVGRPGAWPPGGLAGRLLPALAGMSACGYLWLRHRRGDAGDIAVLVAAGIAFAAWAFLHAIGRGGFAGQAMRMLAPEPVVALDGVDMALENGLYGLLGPNGAGKSTLMRLVVNLYRPSRGTVEINGHEVSAHAASLQPRIGYLPQFFGAPARLTARQYLHHQALLAGRVDRSERTSLVESVLAEVGLADRGDERLGGFSGGMRQRVGIARTLLNVPRIVVVDEPTVGLDPRERIRFRNLLGELARTRIVLLSTHVVEDIGSSCREVFVLDKGRVLFRGTPAEMTERARGHAWLLDLPETLIAERTRGLRVVSTTRLLDGTVRVRGVGPRPDGAEDAEPTLEDAYLLLLGRHARELPHAA